MPLNAKLVKNEEGNPEWKQPGFDRNEFISIAMEDYPGWAEIIREAHDIMVGIDPDYYPVQIKEKFGGLRFYFAVSSAHNYMSDLQKVANEAESKSWKVCEYCGSEKNVTTEPLEDSYWMLTLCAVCRKERNDEKAQG